MHIPSACGADRSGSWPPGLMLATEPAAATDVVSGVPIDPVPATVSTRTDPVYVEILAPTQPKEPERRPDDQRRPLTPTLVRSRGLLPMPVFDCGASMVDGWLVATGGFASDLTATAVIQINNMAKGWRPISTALVQPRAQHRQVTLADGRILVVGGVSGSIDGADGTPNLTPLDTAEVFDPLRAGSTTIQMSQPIVDHTATLLPDGRVVVVGGQRALVFDPKFDSFTLTIRLHRPRAGHCVALAASDGDDDRPPRLVIVGGDEQGTIEELDIEHATSRLWVHCLPVPLYRGAAVCVGPGEVLVIRGNDPDAATAPGEDPTPGAWILGESDTIKPVEIDGLERAQGRAAWFEPRSRRIYLVGGEMHEPDRIFPVEFNAMLIWPTMVAYRLPAAVSRSTADEKGAPRPIRQAWVMTGRNEFTSVGGYRFVSPDEAQATGAPAGVSVYGDVVTIAAKSIFSGD